MTSPKETQSHPWSHVNGSAADLLDRMAVAELCKGWPMCRDNSEWASYRALFTDDAVVWTTWSGPRRIDDFISISKQGKANGCFIQHRENGTLVDLNPSTGRAVGKMKATITQRFTQWPAAITNSDNNNNTAASPIVYDVDCDCRFLFFCLRDAAHNNEWRARFVKLVYEKDKVVPVDGRRAPGFARETLDRFPQGYKFLGAAQEALGYEVDADLATLDGRFWSRVYGCMERWLQGEADPELFWGGEAERAKL